MAALNDFFRLVVETVEEHGGWVNKFQGDAALCVFGAPTARPDAACAALRSARSLDERLSRGLPSGARLHAGNAVDCFAHDGRCELVRTCVSKRSVRRFTDGRADSGNDDWVSH